MGTQPVVPVAATAVAVPVAPAVPAVKLTAIQIIENELGGFLKQKEQVMANLHAVEGALQAGNYLLSRLKAEAIKAEAEAVKLADEAKVEAVKVIDAVEAEAKKL